MRKNLGASHFIIGRDHAGVGKYYGAFDAQKNCELFPDLGIEIMKFDAVSYCIKCERIVYSHNCDHDDKHKIGFSGTDVRKLILNDSNEVQLMIRGDVLNTVKSFPECFQN